MDTYQTDRWRGLFDELSTINLKSEPITAPSGPCRGYYFNGGCCWEVRRVINRNLVIFARFGKNQQAHAAKVADLVSWVFKPYKNPNRKHTPRYNYSISEVEAWVNQEGQILDVIRVMEACLLNSGLISHQNSRSPSQAILDRLTRTTKRDWNTLCLDIEAWFKQCGEPSTGFWGELREHQDRISSLLELLYSTSTNPSGIVETL